MCKLKEESYVYVVEVSKHSGETSLEKNITEAKNSEDEYQSSSICLETVKYEYDYQLNRTQKLENKIGITLAFVGVYLTYIIDQLRNYQHNTWDNLISNINFLIIVKFFCFITIFFIVFSSIVAVFKLIRLLSPVGIHHYNINEIYDETLVSNPIGETEYLISREYLKCYTDNLEINELRFKRYSESLTLVKCSFLAFVIFETLHYYIYILM